MGVDTATPRPLHPRPADRARHRPRGRLQRQPGRVGDGEPDGRDRGGIPRHARVDGRRRSGPSWATRASRSPWTGWTATSSTRSIPGRSSSIRARSPTRPRSSMSAGERWTLPKWGWDQTNFGLFSGDDRLGAYVARNVYEAAERLRAEEDRHLRVRPRLPVDALGGLQLGGVDQKLPTESVVVTLERYLREGRIRVDPSRNAEPVTFHDSCNIARSGDLVEEPRRVLARGLRGFPRDAPEPAGRISAARAAAGCCPWPSTGRSGSKRPRSRPSSSRPRGRSSSARCATTASTG